MSDGYKVYASQEYVDNKTLPIGGEELGGVKNGGNVVINEDGTMTAPVDVTDGKDGVSATHSWN